MTDKQMKEIAEYHTGEPTSVREIKFAKWVLWAGAILGTLILLGFIRVYTWTIVPEHALEIKNAPMAVRPDPVKPEQAVFVHFDFCKKIKSSGQVRTSLVSDETEIFRPVYTDRLPKGCDKLDAPVLLPPQAVPNKYRVHYRVTYKVNPIRTIVEDFYSQEFTIEPDGDVMPSNNKTQ